MKLKKDTIILIVGSFIGLSLLLYPTFADYWNRTFVTHVIDSYVSNIETVDKSIYRKVWDEAVAYNQALAEQENSYGLSAEQTEAYESMLVIGDTRIMGYIDIPKINVMLPIYHGVSDVVLQTAVGHVEWSSLPTGGAGTHCVLSGHRGLQSAKLFTDLDLLREGDIFTIRVLNELMSYEVDQIRVVEPNDVSELSIDPDMDFCTLVTCTPYGVNTHRLLVRGHRVENVITANVISEAVLIDRVVVGMSLAGVFVFILILAVMFQKPKPKQKPITVEDLKNHNDEKEKEESDETIK